MRFSRSSDGRIKIFQLQHTKINQIVVKIIKKHILTVNYL
jgi:hypothetical protein